MSFFNEILSKNAIFSLNQLNLGKKRQPVAFGHVVVERLGIVIDNSLLQKNFRARGSVQINKKKVK